MITRVITPQGPRSLSAASSRECRSSDATRRQQTAGRGTTALISACRSQAVIAAERSASASARNPGSCMLLLDSCCKQARLDIVHPRGNCVHADARVVLHQSYCVYGSQTSAEGGRVRIFRSRRPSCLPAQCYAALLNMYRAIFQPFVSWRKMKISRLASALFAPVARMVCSPLLRVRA